MTSFLPAEVHLGAQGVREVMALRETVTDPSGKLRCGVHDRPTFERGQAKGGLEELNGDGEQRLAKPDAHRGESGGIYGGV